MDKTGNVSDPVLPEIWHIPRLDNEAIMKKKWLDILFSNFLNIRVIVKLYRAHSYSQLLEYPPSLFRNLLNIRGGNL